MENKLEGHYTKEDLERLLDSMPFSAWIKSKENKYIYVNEVYANTVGDTKENVLGRYDSDYWSEEACKCCHESDEEVIESRMPKMFEEVRGEGIYKRWFETYKEAIFNEDGEFKYIMGTSREITLTKTLNESLYESKRGLDLFGTKEIVNHKAKDDEMIRTIEMDIFKWLDASGTAIWLYGESDHRAQLYTKTGRNAGYIGNTNYLEIHKDDFKQKGDGKSIEGILPIEQRRKYVNMDLMKKSGIKNMGIYKIEHDNEILGILTCSFTREKKLKVNQDNLISETCKKIGNIIEYRLVSAELRNKIEAYKNTEMELNLFLETVVDLRAVIGGDNYFKRVSDALGKLFGWNEEEFLNKTWIELMHPDDLKVNYESIMANKELDIIRGLRGRCKCKDGSYKWLEADIRLLREQEIYLIAASDITKQVEAEKKAKELQKVIEFETLKTEFFANISHEFKTPINIILGTVQLMSSRLDDHKVINGECADFRKYCKFIKQNSYRLLRLVNNLIDITKIDSGHYSLHLENHNIVHIVEEITLSVAGYMQNKDIELIFDTEIEEQMLACDTDKIERIMLNLLSNSVKYTDRGGQIQVYLRADEEYVYISVEDNGIGISKEKLNVIFERFVQVDNILTRQAEGSGIGLSLVKSIVEMHDGKVEVESELGKGTKITVQLPIRLAESRGISSYLTANSKIEKCTMEFSDVYW